MRVDFDRVDGWTPEVPALTEVGAQVANRRELSLRLDALGNDADIQIVSVVNECADKAPAGGIAVDCGYELTIELDHIRAQGGEVGQA